MHYRRVGIRDCERLADAGNMQAEHCSDGAEVSGIVGVVGGNGDAAVRVRHCLSIWVDTSAV